MPTTTGIKTKTYKTNIRADHPTPKLGRIFPRDLLERAIREFMKSDSRIGMLQLDGDTDSIDLNPSYLSHHVDNVFLDDEDHMWIEVSFIDSARGRLAALVPDMLEASVEAVGFCGWKGDSNIVVEAGLLHVHLRPKGRPVC